MVLSRSALVASIHLSHFASTYILIFPCNIFVDNLVLLNAAFRGFDTVPLEEVRVISERAVRMLWDTRWSTALRPVHETARILQKFHQVFFNESFPTSEAGLQEEHKHYRPDIMKA
jgi:hypothetical protein